MRKALYILLCLLVANGVAHATDKKVRICSPDRMTTVEITLGNRLTYSFFKGNTPIVKDCRIDMLIDGKSLCTNCMSATTKTHHQKETIQAPFYRNPHFSTEYNAVTIQLKIGISVEFRAYDEGIAYRFATTGFDGKDYIVNDEVAEFNFTGSGNAYLPYSTNQKNPEAMAFQATYSVKPLKEQPGNNLVFLPSTVEVGHHTDKGEGINITLMESNLESYPGMFVRAEGERLTGWFARRPKTFDYYPGRVQRYVKETEDYIARCSGNRSFPWRILALSYLDTEMPVNNLVYALAEPNRIGNTSWIEPGLVSWDWWNDWGISQVSWKAGINMDTYRYYIDFAQKYGIPYIILDEGWYAPKSGDMLTTIPEINLPKLVEYGNKCGVKIILWTVFNVLDDQLDAACEKYADMGIAGFKVDFLDRDDQEAVEMTYRIAEACAKHHLMLDYHGIYPPKGINRTYPNIVNFESVFGMEEAKWTKVDEKDMPLYDVTFPFIRQQTGFTDFTPGGMRNATRTDFHPIYNNPMTMGTRCHQLAMYIVQDSPLTMLADNPTAYEREPEYTKFLASLPTLFDETRILQGVMGKYIVTARRKGNVWYVAGQTNWDERDLRIDFDFLTKEKAYDIRSFVDGVNADKDATDYTDSTVEWVTAEDWKEIHLAPGGGFLLKFEPSSETSLHEDD